jgi:hypothetical protein
MFTKKGKFYKLYKILQNGILEQVDSMGVSPWGFIRHCGERSTLFLAMTTKAN